LLYETKLKGLIEGRKEGRKEGREEGREEGRIEGEEIGMKKAKIEMALSAKRLSLSISDIMKMTGLSKAEIESL
jgi:predicted transposase/invertase (TIGR01784 family)